MSAKAWGRWTLVALLAGLGWSNTTPTTMAGVPAVGTPCNWQNAGEATDEGFGDKKTFVWSAPFSTEGLPAGTKLIVKGEYPHARYLSIRAYDHETRHIGGLFDQQIQPDAGSSNPFISGADRDAEPRAWTVTLSFENPPASPAANTIYLGKDATGNPTTEGVYLVRYVFPDKGAGSDGDVDEPQVYAVNASGQPGTCPSQDVDLGGSPNPDPPSLTNPLTWKHVNSNTGLPNPDLRFIVSTFRLSQFDPVLVIKFKRPSFSNTFKGQVVSDNRNMRYFSMTSARASLLNLGDVVVTLPDAKMKKDADNFVTLVISRTEAKPTSDALQAAKATYMKWSPPENEQGALLLRHLLVNPSFDHSTFELDPSDSDAEIRAAMDDYYPKGVYCTTAQFNQDGCADEIEQAGRSGRAR